MRLLPALLLLFVVSIAQAGDLVRDERRLWSDGSAQEVWSYGGALHPDMLALKELFWEDGTPRSRQEFVAGVQHGPSRTWYPNGNKSVEESWVDGGLHGVVRHWPDPYDDKERRAELKPKLEATWQTGALHGVWREWEGWGDDRWLRTERHYQHGQLHGSDTVWRDADGMERQHAWSEGLLHGRQLAWDYNGEMLYQHRFEHGVPDGPQRAWERDTIVVELFFVAGRLHGTQTFEEWQGGVQEWSNGLLSELVGERDDGSHRGVMRHRWVPQEWQDSHGALRFHGERAEVDYTELDEQGRRIRYSVKGARPFEILFHEDGRVRQLGFQRTGAQITLYEDGSLARHEERVDSHRDGETRVYDRRGRLVSRQAWDFYLGEHVVTTWHDGQNKACEGNVEIHSGSERGRPTGAWTCWRPDGSLLRQETYGPGPYSGNRPFIIEMTEWDELGRVRFEGSERELSLYDYDQEQPDRLRRRRTVRPIDRSRHGIEAWDPETLTLVRAEVQRPTVLADGAPVLELLGGRGRVMVDEVFRADGSPKATTRYEADGLRSGLQEGWYADGTRAWAFEYLRGSLRGAEEWWKDGGVRLQAVFSTGGDEARVATLVLRDTAGQQWRYDRSGDRPWRGPEGALDACWLYRFDPEAPRPDRSAR
jgi:antitoxin component YwqK of YwqJK toxin-antitoxin module